MWPFKEKKPATPAEELLKQITDILFPPNTFHEDIDPQSGKVMKWQVDYSIDMNLDAALIDLQDGHNDAPVHNTIKDVVKRLVEIRKLLDVHMELNPEAQYIMVESTVEKNESE